MTARVLFIGLDAAETRLLEQGARAGHCPNLARALADGTRFTLGNSLETLPGAIWPEIATGVSGGRIPHFYHGNQLHTGEARRRPVAAEEVDTELYYWVRASRAGHRVAALDMPHTVPAPDINGLQLFEWGNHDRNFAITSRPAALLEEIKTVYGDHPIGVCDRHGETAQGYHALLEALKAGAATKTRLFTDLMARAHWDLFSACYSECHCVGHQFWHFQDPDHPRYDADAPDEFKTAIRTIYTALDTGIGALRDAAGPDAITLILASHGMGRYTGGPNLLGEVLLRMGLTSSSGKGAKGKLWRAVQRSEFPGMRGLRNTLKPLLGRRLVTTMQARAGSLHEPFESPLTQAADLRNNRCGAIRLNLKGREPHGVVAPGNEAAALIETIRAALFELVEPRSGEPIVETIMTAREAYGPDHHPDVPDLLIVFRDDLGVLDVCRSKRLGEIVMPVRTRLLPRSGDHTVLSRLWAVGAPFPKGARYEIGDVLDIGPTILDLLGVPARADIDGRSLMDVLSGRYKGVSGRSAGSLCGPRARLKAGQEPYSPRSG